MTQFTLDTSTASQLANSTGQVELLDPQGNIIGHFSPLPKGANGFDLSRKRGLSEEEVKRRLAQPGRPLAEMLRDLEKIK